MISRSKLLARTAVVAASVLVLAACGNGAEEEPTDEAPAAQEEAEAAPTEDDDEAPEVDATEGETIVLRVGHQNAANEPMELGAVRAGELLEEWTDGRITVETFPAAQLGSENELIEQNQSGAIEMSLPSPSALSSFYANTAVFAIPYSLDGDSEEEQYQTLLAVNDSEVVEQINEEMAQTAGIRALDWSWWYGNRHVTNSVREVNVPEDLEGLQIRTPDAPIHFLPLESFGAAVTPLAFGELYLALQTGTVDGQENPVNVIVAQAFHEVQDHVSLTGHLTQAQVPIINEDLWQSFTDEDRELIQRAFREGGEYQSQLALEANADGVQTLEDEGMQVTIPDLAPFREATANAAQEWADGNADFDLSVFEAFRAAQS